MRFSGEARLDGIAEVVAAVKQIPVIGNGDIRSPADALRMIRRTGCQGLMIGRAALSTPWIFRDTHSLLRGGVVPPPLTIEQIVQLMRDHFYNLCRFRNERCAVLEFRKRISWYAKNLHPCKQLRDEMRAVSSPAEFEAILSRFLAWRNDRAASGAESLVQPTTDDQTILQPA
jgi:tRNA-dihydrouridine synthase